MALGVDQRSPPRRRQLAIAFARDRNPPPRRTVARDATAIRIRPGLSLAISAASFRAWVAVSRGDAGSTQTGSRARALAIPRAVGDVPTGHPAGPVEAAWPGAPLDDEPPADEGGEPAACPD
jgi:hypothetical protein